MEMDRALQIVRDCVGVVMASEGVRDVWPDIGGYSLGEMVEANRLVSEANEKPDRVTADGVEHYRTHMTCGDRIIAAMYALAHFEGEDQEGEGIEGIVRFPDKVLVALACDVVAARAAAEAAEAV